MIFQAVEDMAVEVDSEDVALDEEAVAAMAAAVIIKIRIFCRKNHNIL